LTRDPGLSPAWIPAFAGMTEGLLYKNDNKKTLKKQIKKAPLNYAGLGKFGTA